MKTPTDLPECLALLNAVLNATSTVLILLAVRAAKRKDIAKHRKLILSAVGTSTVFLISYLTRRAIAGERLFPIDGPIRTAYLVLLASHVLLAIASVPLILRTLQLGLRMNVVAHRKIVRWTFPIWLYVSITGVVVYVMLYQVTWR